MLRIQGGGGSISQTIRGLTPGQLYGLQFFYNGRNSGFPYELSLQVNFAGKELANIQNLKPANQDGLTEYHFREVRFTPTEATGLLEFKTAVAAGDATVFLDAISIVPRLANEIAVKNSSFEGTATGANWPGYLQPQLVAGWLAAGGGYGVNAYSPKTFFVEPFLDNGINSDQDNAFFGQGAMNIKQTVSRLTAGQPYTLVFDYNFRDGRGQNSNANPNTGQIDVSIDGNSVFTSEDILPVDSITPYPGFRHTKPFYQAFVPQTPGATSLRARFKMAPTGKCSWTCPTLNNTTGSFNSRRHSKISNRSPDIAATSPVPGVLVACVRSTRIVLPGKSSLLHRPGQNRLVPSQQESCIAINSVVREPRETHFFRRLPEPRIWCQPHHDPGSGKEKPRHAGIHARKIGTIAKTPGSARY